MHEDKRKLCRDVAPDSSEQQLDPDRVGDHEPEQVLVILIRQQGGARQARVVTLQLPVQSNLAQCSPHGPIILINSIAAHPCSDEPLGPGCQQHLPVHGGPGPDGAALRALQLGHLGRGVAAREHRDVDVLDHADLNLPHRLRGSVPHHETHADIISVMVELPVKGSLQLHVALRKQEVL